MDITSVSCTRGEFNECATSLSKSTAWELRSRRDVFGAVFQWLEATYNTSADGSCSPTENSPLLTVYVVYQPDFCVPQLGFFTASLLSMDELHATLPNLGFMNTVLETSRGADAVSMYPLVSCSWNEEAQQHMWLVHTCDTENLLRRCRYDGSKGDVLSVFIRALFVYFPFAASLIPPA